MKKIKSILIFSMSVILASGSLTACGSNDPADSSQQSEQSISASHSGETTVGTLQSEQPDLLPESDSDNTADSAVQSELSAQYEALLPDLGVRAEEWENEMSKCTDEEKKIMQYYFITTKMSDLCSIDFSLLHSYATHAAMLREKMPWAKALDEDTFLCYVASYRVFNEPTVDCRPFFFNELSDAIEGKTLEEAALLVNKWCGENATYSESDQREASPLGMYNGGYGRCGEEANFVVNALRSVGIPARVCGLDWTVVSDGHAVIQVLVDGEWHYMGGCEPDPVLDSGWFTGRLGSLLYTHSYSWSDIGVGQPFVENNGVSIVNDIANFADTKDITITVLDENGQSASGVTVELFLVQQGVYIMNPAPLVTDENGEVCYTLGLGSIGAIAYHNGDWREVWIEQDQTEATISFAEKVENNKWLSLPVKYNEAETKRVQTFTEEEKAAFFDGKDYNEVRTENHANDLDEERAAAFPDCAEKLKASGKNSGELLNFLEKDDDPMRSVLVAGISDKYSREVSAEVLEDILQGAENVRGDLSDEDFINGILFPVYDWSYFTPQRLTVQQMFTEKEMSAFRADPSELYKWFKANVNDNCIRKSKGGVPALSSALKMGFCPENSQTTLLMELARAVGIPVMQNEETGEWLYLGADGWSSAAVWSSEASGADDTAYGTVQYLIEGSEKYMGNNWAILGLSGDESYDYYLYWNIEDIDEDYAFELPVGDYAIVMLDMPEEKSGTLYYNRISVEEGNTIEISLP